MKDDVMNAVMEFKGSFVDWCPDIAFITLFPKVEEEDIVDIKPISLWGLYTRSLPRPSSKIKDGMGTPRFPVTETRLWMKTIFGRRQLEEGKVGKEEKHHKRELLG